MLINLKVNFGCEHDVDINPNLIESVTKEKNKIKITMSSGTIYDIIIDTAKEKTMLTELRNLA